jgi:hypothetical protein
MAEENEGQDAWLSDFLAAAEDQSDSESDYEIIQEELEGQDPVKQMSRSMDDLQKKFDQNMMQMRIEKFMDTATDNQKALFKAVSADIKDIKTLDKMMATAKEKGAAMDEQMKAMEEEMEKKRAASIWSTPGQPPKLTADEEENIKDRIAQGDSKAALHAMFGGDKILGEYF